MFLWPGTSEKVGLDIKGFKSQEVVPVFFEVLCKLLTGNNVSTNIYEQLLKSKIRQDSKSSVLFGFWSEEKAMKFYHLIRNEYNPQAIWVPSRQCIYVC